MASQNGSIDGNEVMTAVAGSGRPDPEVPERLERARRRQFTVGYKLRILSEADAGRTSGEIGALLRQENERLSQRLVAAEAVIEVQKSCVAARAGRAESSERRALLMAGVAEIVPVVGAVGACAALGVSRASYYREAGRRRAPMAPRPPPSPRHEGAAGERSELSVQGASAAVGRRHPRALSPTERAAVLDALHAPRFRDAAPATVYATLLDEHVYLASERTMYRLLAAEGETRPRRDQLVHPTYAKPELLATSPNQVWSWDITKLLGPATWTYFYLYVILDIYSRYVVGWMIAHREHADLAERLIG
jgi:putative transposase